MYWTLRITTVFTTFFAVFFSHIVDTFLLLLSQFSRVNTPFSREIYDSPTFFAYRNTVFKLHSEKIGQIQGLHTMTTTVIALYL